LALLEKETKESEEEVLTRENYFFKYEFNIYSLALFEEEAASEFANPCFAINSA